MLGIKQQYIHCNTGNIIENRTTIYRLGIESNNNIFIENRAISRQLLIKFRSLPFQFRRPMLTSLQQLAENGEHNRIVEELKTSTIHNCGGIENARQPVWPVDQLQEHHLVPAARLCHQHKLHQISRSECRSSATHQTLKCCCTILPGWVKFWRLFHLREGVNWKKTFSFGDCPNYLNPLPPHDPNSGNLHTYPETEKTV